HVGTNHGLTDPLGVGRVVLVGFDERPNVLRRDQPDIMAEAAEFARPVMAARACLDTDKCSRQSRKKHDDLRSAKSPAKHASSLDISSVHLEYVLGYIEADHCRIRHVTSLGL